MVNTVHEVSLQEGYRRWATQYDQEVNPLIVLEEKMVLPLLETIPARRVLDLGTGTGRYALRLAVQGARVVALDQSEAMLAVARQSAAQAGVQIDFHQQSLDSPFPGEAGSFDLALAALVLCHVPDLAFLAQEAYRLLRPGGHFLITDFHPAVIAAGWRTQFPQGGDDYYLPTANHSRESYLTALRDAGFRIETVLDGLVRDADGLPEHVIASDGDKPFCLVVLAEKMVSEL
jgi:SAM-dependent methyltransferase